MTPNNEVQLFIINKPDSLGVHGVDLDSLSLDQCGGTLSEIVTQRMKIKICSWVSVKFSSPVGSNDGNFLPRFTVFRLEGSSDADVGPEPLLKLARNRIGVVDAG